MLTDKSDIVSSLTGLQSLTMRFKYSYRPSELSSLGGQACLQASASRLSSLVLKNDPRARLPKGFGNLIRLQHLDLKESRITRLPDGIGSLGCLTQLDLGRYEQLTCLRMAKGVTRVPCEACCGAASRFVAFFTLAEDVHDTGQIF